MTSAEAPAMRRAVRWMILGLFASVGLLGWFSYQAVTGWQRTATLLAQRHANESAGLLAMALMRDMRAVQASVLTSPQLDEFMVESAYDVTALVASAFARYPYPEAFFGARGPLTSETVMFFNRADRTPAWLPASGPARFPVTVAANAPVALELVDRLGRDAARGRRFSTFETVIGGTPYQVVARLLYTDPLRQNLGGVFGFLVDIEWVRAHYFSEVTHQVTRIGRVTDGLSLMVLDHEGAIVAGDASSERRESRQRFPLLFFDPLLVALDPPDDLPQREWAVAVNERDDPALVTAISGAQRTLVAAGLSAVALVAGAFLTLRATQARANLAELRSDFVSTVTHELKTPIATIRAIGDTLVSGRVSTPEGHRQYAGMVVQEAKRLTRLVDNLLAYARITDLTEAYSFDAVAPHVLVDELLQRFRAVLSADGFDVAVHLPAELPPVRADLLAMELLLDNLLDNAIRYSGRGRHLAITGAHDGEWVRLSIRDHGMGIPPEELSQVTRKFFRGRRAGSGGSGLGLAIASRIVTDHGGTLTIDSKVDWGTTVTVALPATRKANVQPDTDC